jgi:uncharacterized membrane protein YozB (DUF420 family)
MEVFGEKLAALNACLNFFSAVCLVMGYRAIRRGDQATHRRAMITAFIVSIVFLISYLTRFYLTGVHRYPGNGLMKTIYLTILTTHTILAAITPFLAIRTLYLGLKGRNEEHRRIAKFTFPIWLYVSVTGVVVYLLLYQLV